MKKEMTETELREMEIQLGRPSGELGIEIGEIMNETNTGMTRNSIEFLDLQDGNSVLELGHGNCRHLEKLLETANNLCYCGLEISDLMHEEAQRINQEIIANQKADLRLYDGLEIPYSDNYFDRIMTVNTIYFWKEPIKLLHEIGRKLKPNGHLVITFAQKNFMKNLPFVGQHFTLYDKGDIDKLVKKSKLELTEYLDKTEVVKSKAGESVERFYSMAKLTKK
ncbi:class I SAM-dependent methyltransferase [Fulvivirga sp. 29W222]|uniref:Class I SAM-dependent methyltransferase n=1 Tax=Fulvivirga marina TaxID=2494733 RepID=A0A937KBP6_9BACT|nr:class I SAM-dependent methyltransferase [Fulvivirga marina]MBL6446359.1 class I SAM-dependent methyltransferase [Fulvivirga marina]